MGNDLVTNFMLSIASFCLSNNSISGQRYTFFRSKMILMKKNLTLYRTVGTGEKSIACTTRLYLALLVHNGGFRRITSATVAFTGRKREARTANQIYRSMYLVY